MGILMFLVAALVAMIAPFYMLAYIASAVATKTIGSAIAVSVIANAVIQVLVLGFMSQSKFDWFYFFSGILAATVGAALVFWLKTKLKQKTSKP